ncbi:hypothetical protein NADRNF5_1539 [Nitrosopumilus adriaticus]|uniref:Uncharacterized protein n=1 Tax=Nitrosopumilus adriaticus TaxID=1580092 RepID=A0A0D5C4E1_9ARCH|nr:hypothetical protein NADRNF5_1539 [Nitrosopumilus adriaticus]
MICNMLGCDSEAFTQVMHYYFEEGIRRPFAKCIMRFCTLHAKLLTQDDVTTRIQVLN